MDAIDEIKARLNIVDVVFKYITLKKAGRNLKGVCPFHNDTNPSFVVSPSKNFAWCFACQNGGDIFSFVQKIENVSFPEAVGILAEWAGVEVHSQTPEKFQQQKEEKEVLREILKETQKFFVAQFQVFNPAREYVFQKRQFSTEISQKFGIGYAPNEYHALEEFLVKKGFSRKDLLKAGVVTTKDEKGESVYDKFRNRIVFPVLDGSGNICGFGGRALGNEDPKYLNSPESPLYEKSKLIYGLSEAKKSIQETEIAIVVEGNFDVIACHQHGITNTVASSGTAFTAAQVKILQRFAKKAVLAFDADDAGKAATLRALEIFFTAGMEVAVARIPGGKDPDEALKYEPEEMRNALNNPIPASQFLFEALAEKHPISTARGKMSFLEAVFPFLHALPNEIERKDYISLLSLFLQVDTAMVEREFFASASHSKVPVVKAQQKGALPLREYALGFFLAFPQFLSKFLQQFTETSFEREEEKKFFVFFKDVYNGSGVIDPDCFFSLLPDHEREKLQRSLLYADEKCGHFSAALLETEADNIATESAKLILSERVKSLSAAIRNPSPTADILELSTALRSALASLQGVHH
ncbi:MAG: DNA primase [Candidatus Peregrinibacteria bacterium]